MFWPYNLEHFITPYQIVKKIANFLKGNEIGEMVKTANVMSVRVFSKVQALPVGICLFDVDNGGTGTGCEELKKSYTICLILKLRVKSL